MFAFVAMPGLALHKMGIRGGFRRYLVSLMASRLCN